jgi:hypothetical protein
VSTVPEAGARAAVAHLESGIYQVFPSAGQRLLDMPQNVTPSYLTLAATDADKNEGDSGTTNFTFTVTRGGSSSGTVSADWAVTGSGANPAVASDFVGAAFPSGTVSLGDGVTSAVITVPVQGDITIETDKAFMVTLSSPVNTFLATATATGTIRNDDTGYNAFRVLISAVQGGGTVAEVGEFEVLGLTDQVDVLTGGTATASSTNATQVPALAADNNGSTYWQTAAGAIPATWTYTLAPGLFKTVWALTVRVGSSVNTAPVTFSLQGSKDGSNWLTLKTWTYFKWNYSGPSYFPVNGECWRVHITAVQGGSNQAAVAVFDLTTGGVSQLSGGVAICASENSTNLAAYAVDGNTATFWSNPTSVAVLPQWIGYLLPNGVSISPDTLRIRVNGAANAPSAFTLQKSVDGGDTWTTVQTYSKTDWTNFQDTTFAL